MRNSRTLAQMTDRVRRYLNDVVAEHYADDIIADYIEEAAETLWNLLSEDKVGFRALRKISGSSAITAEQQDYSIPTDCLRIERLEQSSTSGADTIWIPLMHEEIFDGIILSGTASQLGSPSGATGAFRWNDLADEMNKIRLYPEPKVTSENIRFVYLHQPPMVEDTPVGATAWTLTSGEPAAPTSYTAGNKRTNDSVYYECIVSHTAAAANEPGTGADWRDYWKNISFWDTVPHGCDSCVEYLAASLIAHEELEDGRPIGAFGQQFAKKFREIVGGIAGGFVRPQRRYVRHV